MTSIEDRKDDHIQLALDENNQTSGTSAFDALILEHDCVPEVSLEDIDLTTKFINHTVAAPLIIGAMTGGSNEGDLINKNLAIAAQTLNLPLAVGSQRAAIESGRTQKIREYAPDAFILGNLGATQVRDYGVKFVRKACESISADAMVIHFNPLQELIQPEGDKNWSGILDVVKKCADSLSIPIIAKEVGSGISAFSAKKLLSAGIDWIEIAGKGGTNWARIELNRNPDEQIIKTAYPLLDWGMNTVSSARRLRRNFSHLNMIGSGGVRNGLDIAKCIALGCNLTAIAQPFLAPARKSPEEVISKLSICIDQLRWALFLTGCKNIEDLKKVKIYEE